MEGKPDWLPGFPVQIYCNRSIPLMMIRMNENRTHFLHKRIMALVAALLVSISPLTGRA